MTTSATQPQNSHTAADRAASPPPTGGRFEKTGGNYSRFVLLMRIALPVAAAAIIALVVAWPQLGEKPKGFRLGVSKVTIHDSGGQQIVNPRFSSTDANQRPFNLTADSAFQQKQDPNLVDLAFPKADMTKKTGTWMALSADSGLYNRKSEILNLKGTVNLFHDSGYELKTSVAQVNMAEGTAEGNDAISGHGPGGTVKGAGFRILERGKTMIFTGKSQMVLYPKSKQISRGKTK
ncbi:MAG: LPS export ABC transporter periplasmic protein LptC [Rhodospirillaceae bacterium]|nr:LPS export ABC transporter periplasmic protein LptC [Rhodospirillaceae bacterium]|tara:strand:- start:49987 stop:50691 length:705 start_codon:yes stop_codon:yes gene_type:complete